MISDNMKNVARYEGLSEAFAKGFAFIKRAADENLEKGKYEIDGTNLYAFVQEYNTNDQGTNRIEAHKEYIDIQCILSGVEVMEAMDVAHLTVNEDLEGKDACFYNDHEKLSRLVLQAGDFVVFFTGEGHKPGVAFGASAPVRKVVVKIKM